PTKDEMQRVLTGLSALRIRGRASANLDGRLDNFSATAICADNPPLAISPLDTGHVLLSWPLNAFCYQLAASPSLQSFTWTTNVALVSHSVSNGAYQAVADATNGSRFYKLISGVGLLARAAVCADEPVLAIHQQASGLLFSWPTNSFCYQLAASDSLASPL